MQLAIEIPDLGIKFDYFKVTFVMVIPSENFAGVKTLESLQVNFVGGDSFVIPEWNIKKWDDFIGSVLRQVSLLQPNGGGHAIRPGQI